MKVETSRVSRRSPLNAGFFVSAISVTSNVVNGQPVVCGGMIGNNAAGATSILPAVKAQDQALQAEPRRRLLPGVCAEWFEVLAQDKYSANSKRLAIGGCLEGSLSDGPHKMCYRA
jgi:hypothetical protein